MSIGLLCAFGPMLSALLSIFLIESSRSILHWTPFELCFGRKSFISHLRPFGCKCFVLKCGNLDKFESRSFHGILLVYTPRGGSY
jgi:hypothetical protein